MQKSALSTIAKAHSYPFQGVIKTNPFGLYWPPPSCRCARVVALDERYNLPNLVANRRFLTRLGARIKELVHFLTRGRRPNG